ncbi:hypothetical protein BD413DRAFT_479494, partial [Trametes elegans]
SDCSELLALPVNTAPLVAMSAMNWPRLCSLSLFGMHIDTTLFGLHIDTTLSVMHNDPILSGILPAVVLQMPRLRELSVEVRLGIGLFTRPRLCPQPYDEAWAHVDDQTIAYPDPDYGVFANLMNLRHLPLRDTSRNHTRDFYGETLPANLYPLIPSSAVCIDTMQRVSHTQLVTLEISYLGRDPDD